MEENRTPKKRNYERYLEGETWSPSVGYGSAKSDTNAGYETEHTGESPYYVPPEMDAYGSAPSEEQSPYYSGVADNANFCPGLEEPVSKSEWALALFLTCIPCVGLIMMFVWAFSKDSKKSKANFFKVQLIFLGVFLVLYLLLAFMSLVFVIAQ